MEANKQALVLEYIDLALQYAAIITGGQVEGFTLKRDVKARLYEIREQLGMKPIQLR